MRGAVYIKIPVGTVGFAEDKDEARKLRIGTLLPALHRKDYVTLDFGDVAFSTQSFVHALLGEALQRFGDDVLKDIEFKNCSPQLQSLVQLVVDYSLGGFHKSGREGGEIITPQRQGPQSKPRTKRKLKKDLK